jgi:hypothetical protein
VEEGFYYDVWMGGKQVSESFLKLYEARAAEIIKANQPFERLELTKEEALELFSYNQFKCRIIASKIPDGSWYFLRDTPLPPLDFCNIWSGAPPTAAGHSSTSAAAPTFPPLAKSPRSPSPRTPPLTSSATARTSRCSGFTALPSPTASR